MERVRRAGLHLGRQLLKAQGMNRLLALVLSLFSLSAFPLCAERPTYAGEWQTTYGRMVLKVDGNKVSGTYEYESAGGKTNDIHGTLEGKRLTFTYTEPAATGEGVFTLADDGASFDGQWRPKGREEWGKWSGRRMAGSPIERELQQLNEQHVAALNALLQRTLVTPDDEAARKIKAELAASKTSAALKQAMNDTRWKWFNSATFDSDQYWIDFHADGTARCQWGWPLIWAVEGPTTLFLRRTDSDDYFMHFKMDMTKLQGVSDPRVTKSTDPRSIRFEKRLP
jgi:hypothetical protein